jgi:flagellar biosynthesis/type III secretory pathway chaperone
MTSGENGLMPLIDRLRDLLEEERRALLTGTPELITEVVQRKLALAEAIEAASTEAGAARPPAEAVAALDRYNRENAIICTAMLRHLTGALDALRRHDPHRSYKLDGTERTGLPAHQALGAA